MTTAVPEENTTEVAPAGSSMTEIKKSLFYRAFGVGVLEYIVPTAATAGILTLIAHTIDGIEVGAKFDPTLLLGWFAGVLFVVSTGHSRRNNDEMRAISAFFDLGEAASMVAAFHYLGLVTDSASASSPGFFFALFGYLALVLFRRMTNNWRENGDVASPASVFIIWLSGITAAATLVFAIVYCCLNSSFDDNDRHDMDTGAGLVLCLALVIYIGCVLWRETDVDWKETARKKAEKKAADRLADKARREEEAKQAKLKKEQGAA